VARADGKLISERTTVDYTESEQRHNLCIEMLERRQVHEVRFVREVVVAATCVLGDVRADYGMWSVVFTSACTSCAGLS